MEASSSEEMFTNEQKLVEIGSHSYNLKQGGHGGFSHINLLPKEERPNLIKIKQMIKDGKFNLDGTRYWTDESRKKVIEQALKNAAAWKGKHHSEETKKVIGKKNRDHQQGSKNSQYGTMWITNGIESKKIKKDDLIPEEWRKGRVR